MQFLPHDQLYRRIHVEAYNRTDQRITSAAFKTGDKHDQNISVYVAKLVEHDPRRVIEDKPHHGAAVLTGGDAEVLGFDVVHDPDPSDAELDHAHAIITGINNRTTSKRLAQVARFVAAPPVRTG